MQFSLLILLTVGHGRVDNGLSIAATAVSLAAALFMLALSYAEHSRSPRPSILLNAYVLLTLLFDIAQTRTSWLVAANLQDAIFARLFTSSVVAKAFLLLLEAQRKSRWVRWDASEHSPEESNGLFGLSVYSWLNRLFLRGYRTVLSLEDLYPLDPSMGTDTLFPKFQRQIYSPSYRPARFALAKALARALAVPWLLPIAPRVALIAFKFMQPLFLERLLGYLQESQATDEPNHNIGYGLIGAALLIYVGMAVFGAFYQYYKFRVLYMVRVCLASAIYKKTTEAKLTAGSDGAALTLMSTDVERVVRGFYAIHELWSSMIEVGIGCWLLQRHLGAAFVAPIVTILICTLGITWISGYSAKRQREWMGVIQKRVGLTTTAISTMKGLKITGMVGHVADTIQSLRAADIKAGNRWRIVLLLTAMIAIAPQALSPVFTFAVTSSTLDTTTIYTSMSYLLLLAAPLSMLLQTFPGLVASFTCLTRIQNFLEADTRVDYRKFAYPGSGVLKPSGDESSTDSAYERIERADGIAVGILKTSKLATTASEKQEPITEVHNAAECLETPTLAVRISNGSFGWTAGKMSLSDINATIPASKLTMVVGPVASGKSTFCYALLGEMPYSSGEVTWTLDEFGSAPKSGRKQGRGCGGGVGFCEQNPFLLNATLKENIIGFSSLDQSKYDAIIDATRLGIDVSQMPSGHDTRIGSNGIMLSGGQRQRVSLARALYLESNFVVFDDILSGLDSDTETEVFNRVFGPDGILRRRGATVVLCTHSIRHLPTADHILALSPDGRLIEEGSFQDLMQNQMYIQSLGVEASDSDSSKSGSNIEDEDGGNPRPSDSSQPMGKKSEKPKVLAHHLDKARQMGDWRVYSHYFGAVSKSMLLVILITGILYGFGDNFSTIWMGYWAADTLSRDNSFYIGIFGLLRTSQVIWIGLSGVAILISLVTLTGTALHKNALRTVITAPLSFFTNTDTGIVTNLFSQDMTLIDGELPYSLLNMSFIPFSLVGVACVIAVATPYLASSYPVLVFILYMLQKFYLRTSRQMRLLDLEAKSPL